VVVAVVFPVATFVVMGLTRVRRHASSPPGIDAHFCMYLGSAYRQLLAARQALSPTHPVLPAAGPAAGCAAATGCSWLLRIYAQSKAAVYAQSKAAVYTQSKAAATTFPVRRMCRMRPGCAACIRRNDALSAPRLRA
jgi:hypothetical protein